MKTKLRILVQSAVIAASCLVMSQCATGPIAATNAANSSASQIAGDSRSALAGLYRTNPKARQLGARAEGILVFPNITKGGFMLGGMGGNGALIRPDGSINEFYQTGGLSYGLQAGIQQYGYALFLMDRQAFDNINQAGGWEIGSSPSLVIVDDGVAANLTTTTVNKSTYAVFFNQRGLMGGLGLQGSKITRIYPGR